MHPHGLKRFRFAAAAFVVMVLLVDAIYLFGFKLASATHSDATNTLHIAVEAVRSRSIVPSTWYWANGDVWVLGPQLYAMPIVASWGIGLEQLRGVLVFGFALQLVVLAWSYRSLTDDWLSSVFAAAVSLVAWSRLHALFVYIELAYGFSATTYVAFFALVAAHATSKTRRRALAIACVVYELVLAIQNPTRGLVFGLAPVAIAVAWPFRGFSARARAMTLLAPLTGWVWAKILYTKIVLPAITLSIPSGHVDFVVKDAAGIAHNLALVGRGLFTLSGAPERFALVGIPTLAVTLAALGRVGWEIVASREPTRLRFVCIAAAVQFAGVLAPLVVGNLMTTPPSVRYLIPSLIAFFGLAVLMFWRDLEAKGFRRRIAIAAMALFPVGAAFSLVSVVSVYSYEYESGQWANRPTHATLAAELERRGLSHGFATYWNANIVTMLSKGRAQTCSIFFFREPIPYKWNTMKSCFDRAAMPDRFYIVIRSDEQKYTGLMKSSFPVAPIDRFTIGDEFEVLVLPSTYLSLRWLDGPIPEGDAIHFPLRLRATNVQFGYVASKEVDDVVVMTGDPGIAIFGPAITLTPGAYRVTWVGRGIDAAEGDVTFDVASEAGKHVYARQRVPATSVASTRSGRLATFDFDLPVRTQGTELRVFSENGGRVVLESMTLERR